VRRVLVTVAVLAVPAALLAAPAAAAPVGGASYSGTTAQKERTALTVARTKRTLSRFATVVRATCSDRQRDWTEFILPPGDKSFAIKRNRVSRRVSLAPRRSPAVGDLSISARFGRTVSGSVSGTWRYSDGTTCTSGKVGFKLRRGRYTPPRELSEPHPQHPAVLPGTGLPGPGTPPGTTPTTPPQVPPVAPPPPSRGGDPVAAVAGDIANGDAAAGRTAQTVQSINPDVVLTAGDNAYPNGSLDDFNRFYAPTWGAFRAKTRPAVGNHEYQTPGAAGYFDYFNGVGRPSGPAGAPGQGYYSFDLGSWHFVALNNYVDMTAGSPQVQWLRADLAATTRPCIAAYMHAPRWTSSAVHVGNPATGPIVDALYAARADVLLTGHNHQYERFGRQNPGGAADPEGIREFVVGTGGAPFYPFNAPQPNSQVRDSSSHGVLQLNLHPNSYDWDFRPSDGAFTDSGTTACH
jgi:hypothetical protein